VNARVHRFGFTHINADQIDRAWARPVLGDGLDTRSTDVGGPPHLNLGVGGHGGVHEVPGVDELRGGAVVGARVQVPVHLVAKTKPDLDTLVGELLEDTGDLRGGGGSEGTQRQCGHYGRLEDSAGADHVTEALGELVAVVAGRGNLRVPAVAADLGTEGAVQLGHGVGGRGGRSIAGESPEGDIVHVDAAGGQTVS
jgi:hypothetical protein